MLNNVSEEINQNHADVNDAGPAPDSDKGYADGDDRRRQEKQFTVTGRIKPTRVPGGEAIRFSFRLGPIRVTCIANVPADGEEEAPVYVRLGLVL